MIELHTTPQGEHGWFYMRLHPWLFEEPMEEFKAVADNPGCKHCNGYPHRELIHATEEGRALLRGACYYLFEMYGGSFNMQVIPGKAVERMMGLM